MPFQGLEFHTPPKNGLKGVQTHGFPQSKDLLLHLISAVLAPIKLGFQLPNVS